MAKRGREEEFSRSCIAFDIDGVFKFGRDWSKDGSKALEKVTKAGMPFVFVTNGGGGLSEASYGCAPAAASPDSYPPSEAPRAAAGLRAQAAPARQGRRGGKGMRRERRHGSANGGQDGAELYALGDAAGAPA